MKLKRSEFIAAAGSMLIPGVCLSGGMPHLRVGLLSDTHVNPDPKSCDRTRMAFGVFKRENVDAIAHLGDLSNYHQAEAYRNYRKTIEEAFPDAGKSPKFLYAWGNHDSIDYERRANPKDRQIDRHKAFAVMKDILKIEHGLDFEMELAGYAFLGFPERITDSCSVEEYERRIAAACRRHPGKPVFVLHHPPPYGTCDNSKKGCAKTSLKVLSGYPQVVSINGHKHTSVMNERSIWQGDFTVVQTGCLYNWFANWDYLEAGERAQVRSGYGVMVMDVYADRLVFRRFDVRSGEEYRPDARWTVPIPFSPDTAPYSTARRRKDERSGVFPDGAAVIAKADRKNTWVWVRFPAVVNPGDVRTYKVVAERITPTGKVNVACSHVIGDFDELPSGRHGFLTARFEAAKFKQGEKFLFTVSTEGFFGKKGAALSTEWIATGKTA